MTHLADSPTWIPTPCACRGGRGGRATETRCSRQAIASTASSSCSPIVVTMLAVPVAAGVGTAVYDANRDAYAKQAQSRQNITATVVEGTVAPDLRRNTVRITAQWYWATTQHTGTLRAPPTVKAGDTVEIWVDESGSMVSAPKSATTAVLDATVVGAATWLTVAAVAAFGVAGVRALYGRLRDDAWQRDLDRLMGRD